MRVLPSRTEGTYGAGRGAGRGAEDVGRRKRHAHGNGPTQGWGAGHARSAPETHQSAMGPYVAVAAVGSVL
eukprot:scaffold20724_cov60-Phaeocystis_antarctica.AAC.3